MRTNIVLDNALVEQARKLTGIKTKKELIHEALRTLISLRQQSERAACAVSYTGKATWMSCGDRVCRKTESCFWSIPPSGLIIPTAGLHRKLIIWTGFLAAR